MRRAGVRACEFDTITVSLRGKADPGRDRVQAVNVVQPIAISAE